MNELKELLDMKGLVMHSYHRCNDKDSTLFKEDGKRTARAEAAFETLLDSYLLDILRDTAPKDVIAVWEGGNERRIELFDGYKKKRREKPKDPVVEKELKKLYKYTKSFLAGMGCIQIKFPFAEGDDALAYLSARLPLCSVRTIDGDMIQLASDTCMVTQKDEVKEEDDLGTPPNLIALSKSIIGDTSDEYPGVKGLGKVAWKNMVEDFGIDGMEELDQIARDRNLEELIETAAGAGSKELNAIAKSQYHWLLQYELARLHPEWCENTYKKTIIRPEIFKRLPNRSRVEEVLESCGCMDLLPELECYLPHEVLITADNVEALLYEGTFLDDYNASIVSFDYEGFDKNKFDNFVEVMKGKKGEYVDTLSQEITGASFTWGANLNKTIYICFNHKDTKNCSIEVLRDLLENADNLVCHNEGYEQVVTSLTFGKEEADHLLKGLEDTMIMASYVDENEFKGLKPSSAKYLNYQQASYAETVGDKGDMSQLTGKEVFNYGIDDAITAGHLYSLWDFIMTVEGTRDFCRTYEPGTNRVINAAFTEGIRIDFDRLEKMRDEDQARLDILWPRLRELLEENCTEEQPELADTYLKEIRKFEIAKMTEAGKTEDEIARKLADIRDKFVTGSRYVPYSEETKYYEFIPTPVQLNAARVKIGLVCEAVETEEEEQLAEDPFEIKSVAVSRISEWAMLLGAVTLPKRHQEFVDLVAAAAHQFKSRDGAELEALAQYVQKLFPEKNKVVTSGDELNLDSSIQMGHLMYGKLGLPIRVYTKVLPGSTRERLRFAGGPAANDKAIETALAEDLREEGDWGREVIETVREIKSIQTMFKFYYRPYPLWRRPDDGKIHPGITNCGTSSRRPAGTSPNLLQIKKGKIRSMFLPMREGHVLIAPDFSGQELRILGSESKDPVIYDAYMGENRKDIHSLTASAIMPAITKKLRPDLMKQMKLTADGKAMDYEQYMGWRKSSDKELSDHANFVRNKRAKACIAEGSLVLTEVRGLVPIEGVLLTDKVWDGIDWVTHEGVIYKGVQEVVTYEGLTATPDHEVYTDDGQKLPLQKIIDTCEQERPRLAVCEVNGIAVRYAAADSTSVLGRFSELQVQGKDGVHGLSEGTYHVGKQSAAEADNRVQVPAEEVQRPEAEDIGRKVQGHSPEVRQPELSDVQELRGEGDREQIQESGGVHNVGDGESSSRDLQRGAAGQEEQRRALREDESEVGDPSREPVQQEDNCMGNVQRAASSAAAFVAPGQDGLSGVSLPDKHSNQVPEAGNGPRRGSDIPPPPRRREKVYDIVNAGPSHRFTVSGKIVQNCNFLVNYEGGAGTLSTNIMVPREDAQEFIDGMLSLYKGIEPFQTGSHKLAAAHGYVTTAYGNRRHATDAIISKDDGKRMRMERQVSNFRIQGCAADILKVVMSECLTTGLLDDTESFIMAPVYDEVVCSVPVGHAVEFCQRLQKIMDLLPPGHTIPMVSEFSIGYDWYNMVEFGVDTSEDAVLDAIEQSTGLQPGPASECVGFISETGKVGACDDYNEGYCALFKQRCGKEQGLWVN